MTVFSKRFATKARNRPWRDHQSSDCDQVQSAQNEKVSRFSVFNKKIIFWQIVYFFNYLQTGERFLNCEEGRTRGANWDAGEFTCVICLEYCFYVLEYLLLQFAASSCRESPAQDENRKLGKG